MYISLHKNCHRSKLHTSHSADTRAVNCETNAGTHDLRRALREAQDLNQFFSVFEPRMKARTASFCMERSGHFDGFDQGAAFVTSLSFIPQLLFCS